MTSSMPICLECYNDGKVQRVTQRLGAWHCPVHHDRGHVNWYRPDVARSADEIAPSVPTPETDAAPPEGDDTKLIMLAGAIKAWWMHKCAVCGRYHDKPTECEHTGTWWHNTGGVGTVPMWDSKLHRQYLAYRRDLQAALIATNRYLTYAPHNAFKGRWMELRAQAVNDAAIAAADLMVVMSPRDIPTDGTDDEVIKAAEVGTSVLYIPCSVFSVDGALSAIDEFFEIKETIR